MRTRNTWQELARGRLPHAIYDYVEGGADEEQCMTRNRGALACLQLVPEVLRPVDSCDPSVVLFGKSSSMPLAIAPTGMNGLLWVDGDLILARAAAEFGIPFALSTAASSSLADVAAGCDGDKWFQLYVLDDRELTEQLLACAARQRYRVLLVTVDVPVSGCRMRDRGNGLQFPLRLTRRLVLDALCHPRWLYQIARHGVPQLANLCTAAGSNRESIRRLGERAMDRRLSWRSLGWLREHWPGPIVLKGVLSVADAQRARDCGIDGIVVSNHGGRQLDAAPAPIDVLPLITKEVGRHLTVLVDGGVLRGSDIVKACALGAHGTLAGRAVLYGLAAAGTKGVHAVLEDFREQLLTTMALLGVQTIAELGSRHIFSTSGHSVRARRRRHSRSAMP